MRTTQLTPRLDRDSRQTGAIYWHQPEWKLSAWTGDVARHQLMQLSRPAHGEHANLLS